MSDEKLPVDRLHELGPMIESPISLRGRYVPLRLSSALWPAFLGSLALLIPPMVIFAVRSALAVRREGSRVAWAVAMVWSIAMAVLGCLWWIAFWRAASVDPTSI